MNEEQWSVVKWNNNKASDDYVNSNEIVFRDNIFLGFPVTFSSMVKIFTSDGNFITGN